MFCDIAEQQLFRICTDLRSEATAHIWGDDPNVLGVNLVCFDNFVAHTLGMLR